MKNLNKLFIGLALFMGVSVCHAAGIAIQPKETYVLTYTTVISTITPAISTNAVSTSAFMPGAVYEVILSSGASSEYFQMYDSTGSVSVCGSLPTGSQYLGPRLLFGSTTANTLDRFDPPLVFHNGLVVCDSAATGQTSVTYELGRGLSGD